MISVVMPAYNAEPFIGEAIESILSQTYRDFEFIIVDDGSTDRTLEIACDYERRDARISVVAGNHLGPAAALNLGIECATRKWIAIMHADDVASPQRLEKQITAAEQNPKVVIWGSYAYHIGPTGKRYSISQVGPVDETEFHTLRKAGSLIFVIHPTAMLRKDVVVQAGGYASEFDGTEDLELFDRMAEYGPILAIPEPLMNYRIHSSSVTMARFFKMRRFTRFVRARQQQRLKAQTTLKWEDFQRQCQALPLRKRLRRRVDDQSQFYYRKSGVLVVNESYSRALLYFVASVVLNPRYALRRAWQQRFSPTARATLSS